MSFIEENRVKLAGQESIGSGWHDLLEGLNRSDDYGPAAFNVFRQLRGDRRTLTRNEL